jgi:hypothetical protein
MFRKLKETYRIYSNVDNVLIYQMGKVGSTSLENSLKNSIHIHTLYGNPPCHVQYKQRRNGFKAVVGYIGDIVRRFAIKKRSKIKIISLVREPYSRNVSMFFQDLSHWIYYFVGQGNYDNRVEDKNYLYKVFLESFDHDYLNNWFDKELKRFTGIDIYLNEFDIEKGFSVYKKGKFEVLLVTAESLNDNEDAISKFINHKVSIKSENRSNSKWYRELYQDFKLDDGGVLVKYKSSIRQSKFYKKFYG